MHSRAHVTIVLGLVSTCLVFLPTVDLFAQQPQVAETNTSVSDPFVVPRLSSPINLDGIVDEAAWDLIEPLSLVTHWPEFANEPSERTEIRLAYDDNYVYISCRCYAPPEFVFAASFQRDLNTLGTDYLALALDTYNDNESAVGFFTTPTGTRTDGTIANDGDGYDTTWNTYWDTEVTINSEGWFAEVRIPFSSLRYQPVNGKVIMGISAWRYLGKKNEMDIFPAIPPDWGFWSFFKVSRFQKAAFEGIKTRRPIYVTPYALGGLTNANNLNDAETAYVGTNDSVTDLGGDLKLGLTNNLTLDLTANTDFAQVEADNQQVNLTRFSLFFPEKRQFFLERADLFDFDVGGSNRLFHSRRIGLIDGQSVRLLGGGRLVGRIGAWDIGVLDLQTARRKASLEEDDSLPSENFGLIRLRRQILNTQSTAGGMVTSRIGDDGSFNVAYGLDGDIRVLDDSFVELRWIQTFDDQFDEISLLRNTRMRAVIESRSYAGFGYAAKVERAGLEYRPDMGFELRKDFTVGGIQLWQGWGPGPQSPFSRHQARVSSGAFLRNTDTTLETVESTVSWEGVFPSSAVVSAGIDITYDDLRDGFSLSDSAEVLPGDFTFAFASASLETPGGSSLRTNLNAGAGTFYDGKRMTAGIEPKWIQSRYLTVSGGYEYNRIEFSDRDETFASHVASIRVDAAINPTWTLSSFLQLNSTSNAGFANLRLRYNPREGTDVFVVFNSGFNTMERTRVTPNLPFSSERTVLVKLTHTFAI